MYSVRLIVLNDFFVLCNMEKLLKSGLKFLCFFFHDPEIQKKFRARASLWKDGCASIESALIKKEAKLRSSPRSVTHKMTALIL